MAESQCPAEQPSPPNTLRAKMMIAAALALVACRLIGAWQSIAGMAAAGLVMTALVIGIVSISPRLRRFVFCLMLPLAVVANAATLAIGSCLACMGSQGLLPGGRLGMKVPWTPLFWCVPLAAVVSLFALAMANGHGLRNRRGAALAGNLMITLFAIWYWTIHGSQSDPNGAPPLGAVLLLALTAITLAAIVWDAPQQNPDTAPNRRRAFWRIAFVSAVAVPIATTIAIAFLPVYRHRRTVAELEARGFLLIPGRLPPWAGDLEEFLAVYDYLADVVSVEMKPSTKLIAAEAERVADLLNQLRGVSSIRGLKLCPGAERLLRPLKGKKSITLLSLSGPGVTDDTLTDVAALPGLKSLQVSESRVTTDGVARIRRLLPSAHFGAAIKQGTTTPLMSAAPAANAGMPSRASPASTEPADGSEAK